ncbi:uncharacterized protein C8A04DRAFT_32611 [Dichotomopilus funicola]|uniref:Uncharacterized protein n=1 Tax=Dichotomopilus funicola TaxID=1934379 RepID=A0AAN6UVT9_9PEZI|nr:hypothetical protein C8A04DRAFT_32611 [Dichotomopilus funicola]
MYFNAALLGLVAAASSVAAAPSAKSRPNTVSAMADVPAWIITSFTRTCNEGDTTCDVTFGIDTQTAPATDCAYTVIGSPASQTATNGIVCGPYTISSSWSGQFGPENGFTTWSVIDWDNRLIAWPAYNDQELVNATAVTPDKSFTPQTLA